MLSTPREENDGKTDSSPVTQAASVSEAKTERRRSQPETKITGYRALGS